jgi:hypothetical protein
MMSADASTADQPSAKKPASDKQQAANRRNAGRSTGPKTAAGKARSSRNATTHGAYAMAAPIPSGPFVEDSDEVAGFVGDIIGGLGPRDAVERVVAEHVATTLLRAQRVGRYSAHRIAEATTLESVEQTLAGLAADGDYDEQAAAAAKLYKALNTISVIDARIGREIQRSLEVYRKLQQRPDDEINAETSKDAT